MAIEARGGRFYSQKQEGCVMNSVNIIGRVGKKSELRHMGDGKAVGNFSLALDEGKDKPPTWVDVTIFEKTAEAVNQYLNVGDECAVSGRLKQEKWEKDGQPQSKLVVVASRVDFLRKKGEKAEGGAASDSAVPKGREAAVAQAQTDDYGPMPERDDPFGDGGS